MCGCCFCPVLRYWLVGEVSVICSVSVLEDFCSGFPGQISTTHRRINHPLALTRGVLCTRLCRRSSVYPFHHNRSCIGFHPSHITVRSTATRVTLLRFVGTKGSRSTIPTAIRYSRLVRTGVKTGASVTATARDGDRICSFLGSISSGCNVNF